MSKEQEFMGKLCKDKVTGFEGICTGRIIWLYGCDQYALTPKVSSDNPTKVGDNAWFDEGRLEVIGNGITKEEVKADEPGGVHDSTYYPQNNNF